jgi:hypothetical protein
LIIPNREFVQGKTVCIFNPFHTFSKSIEMQKIEFEFTVVTNDWSKKYSTTFSIIPENVNQTAAYQLPVKETSIIADGNDFYSHHRRFDFTHPAVAMLGIKKQSNRYAYDFRKVNEAGETFANGGEKLADWYCFGQNIYAISEGEIVNCFGNAIDADIGQIAFNYDEVTKNPELMNGNFVLIKHADKTYSFYMHMKQGSLKVKTGDKVKTGQLLGQIGNSGDSYEPHLHFQLCDGTDFMDCNGIPIYFSNFSEVQGKKVNVLKTGYLETGEFVKNK